MLFQNKCLPLSFIALCLLLAAGCGSNRDAPSPENYRLGEPQENALGKGLNEISGIAFRKQNKLLAVSDSKEKIVQIDLETKKLKDVTGAVVPPDSDLEDVVEVDSSIYVLQSRGALKEVREGAADTAGVKTYDLGLPGKNDFETVYYDATAGGLVLLCKSCAHEKGRSFRSAYRFDLSTKTFDSTVFFTISKDEVRTLLNDREAKFDPSAAAVHPLNKRLYILSSAGNLLVITDTRGKVIAAYKLSTATFPQAEGIAFAPNGDMYIANEGKSGSPTLLLFPHRQHGKKKEKK